MVLESHCNAVDAAGALRVSKDQIHRAKKAILSGRHDAGANGRLRIVREDFIFRLSRLTGDPHIVISVYAESRGRNTACLPELVDGGREKGEWKIQSLSMFLKTYGIHMTVLCYQGSRSYPKRAANQCKDDFEPVGRRETSFSTKFHRS